MKVEGLIRGIEDLFDKKFRRAGDRQKKIIDIGESIDNMCKAGIMNPQSDLPGTEDMKKSGMKENKGSLHKKTQKKQFIRKFTKNREEYKEFLNKPRPSASKYRRKCRDVPQELLVALVHARCTAEEKNKLEKYLAKFGLTKQEFIRKTIQGLSD